MLFSMSSTEFHIVDTITHFWGEFMNQFVSEKSIKEQNFLQFFPRVCNKRNLSPEKAQEPIHPIVLQLPELLA